MRSTAPTADTANLRRLAEAATPGPWTTHEMDGQLDAARYPGNGAVGVFADGDCEHHAVADCSCNHTCRMQWDQEANAAYIAAASPDVVIGLLNVVEAAERFRVADESFEATSDAVAALFDALRALRARGHTP